MLKSTSALPAAARHTAPGTACSRQLPGSCWLGQQGWGEAGKSSQAAASQELQGLVAGEVLGRTGQWWQGGLVRGC